MLCRISQPAEAVTEPSVLAAAAEATMASVHAKPRRACSLLSGTSL